MMDLRTIFNGWRFGAILLLCATCSSQPGELATVGKSEISRQDMAYHAAVSSAYGNSDMKDSAALVSLVHLALEREVGRAHGVVVNVGELDSFSRYVDESSKAPDILVKVKAVFGSDTGAYRRLFLAPKVMSTKLREWFSRDPSVQAGQRKAIEKAWGEIHSGKGFEEAAKSSGLAFSEQKYEAGSKKAPDALQLFFPEGVASMTPAFRTELDKLEPGQLAETIIEDDYTFRIVRLVELNDAAYRTEEIVAKKLEFGPWYREQVVPVSVTVHDNMMLIDMCRLYSKLWWLAGKCQ
jgi:hypothetical protein